LLGGSLMMKSQYEVECQAKPVEATKTKLLHRVTQSSLKATQSL